MNVESKEDVGDGKEGEFQDRETLRAFECFPSRIARAQKPGVVNPLLSLDPRNCSTESFDVGDDQRRSSTRTRNLTPSSLPSLWETRPRMISIYLLCLFFVLNDSESRLRGLEFFYGKHPFNIRVQFQPRYSHNIEGGCAMDRTLEFECAIHILIGSIKKRENYYNNND